MLNGSNTFFVADFHFDHTNIIKYANRPFVSAEEMNQVLLNRYNEVVSDDSTVYFLGDMSFGRGSRKPKWWLGQLRGRVIYIKGSHDHGIRPTNLENCFTELVLDTGVGKVLLTHEPRTVNNGMWQIHGHTHDTRMVDTRKKRVCVSVEAIGYRPVSLDQIREAIKHEHTNIKEVQSMRR